MKDIVLITGASRGIGKETAYRFAREGAALALVCHNRMDELETIKAELESAYHTKVAIYQADAGSYEDMKTVVDDVSTRLGPVTILINNAGIAFVDIFSSTTPEVWNQMISTNLTSVYNTCHLCTPSMIHSKSGRIINVSSVWGNVGASCEVAYSASKGGVNAFTKALAKELAPSGISVNAIAFGCIDTDMNSCLSEEDKSELCEEIPIGRMASATEAAECIYDLATTPKYLTGQIITFDGGWT